MRVLASPVVGRSVAGAPGATAQEDCPAEGLTFVAVSNMVSFSNVQPCPDWRWRVCIQACRCLTNGSENQGLQPHHHLETSHDWMSQGRASSEFDCVPVLAAVKVWIVLLLCGC